MRSGQDRGDPDRAAAPRIRAAERRRSAARAGEDAAAAHLASRGYELLARNLRVGRNEIDILAVDPETRAIVIVEVKCRTDASQRPEERVDHGKRRGLIAAAERLSLRRDWRGANVRFDVIAVTDGRHGPEIVHFPAAFDLSSAGDRRHGSM